MLLWRLEPKVTLIIIITLAACITVDIGIIRLHSDVI